MRLGESAEGDPIQEIIDARDEILEVIQRKMDDAYNSRRGYRPEEDGSYCDGYYYEKERGEIYGSFWRIFNVTDEEVAAYPSLKEYLTEKCQSMMWYSEDLWGNIMAFIEQRFKIKVEPLTEPLPYEDASRVKDRAETTTESESPITETRKSICGRVYASVRRAYRAITEPPQKHRLLYRASVSNWAERFGVTETYIENLIPYKSFYTLIEIGQSDLVIHSVNYHFKVQEERSGKKTPYYKWCVNCLAKVFRVKKDEIEELMPFETFEEDRNAAVDKVLDHFKAE